MDSTNEDTGELLRAIAMHSGDAAAHKRALQALYRQTFDRTAHHAFLDHGGHARLARIASDPSVGLDVQLYAFGGLRNLYSTQLRDGSTVCEMPPLQLRDATVVECDQWRQCLSLDHPVDAQIEATEVLTALQYAHPHTHGLDVCVREIVGLLQSESVVLSTSAVRAVVALSMSTDTASNVVQQGVIPVLADLVLLGEPCQQAESARALGYLARNNRERQDAVARTGVIDVLLDFVFSGTGDEKTASCFALSQLARDNKVNAVMMIQQGDLHAFLAVANEDPRDATKLALKNALQPYAHAAPMRTPTSFDYTVLETVNGSIDESKSIATLISILREAKGEELTTALRWMYFLVYKSRIHSMIYETNGITSLPKIATLHSSSVEQRLYAYGCLAQLDVEPSKRRRLLDR